MAMRTMWKGHIRFELIQFPINLFKATEDMKKEVQLNQFHKGECGGAVSYIKKCKKCETVLEANQITKGHLIDDDKFVEITDADIESIKLKSTKVIEIEGFCDPAEIDPLTYEDPYYIGPQGPVAFPVYDVLVQAMKKSKSVAIARVTVRDREDKVVIMPYNKDSLVMYQIRYPEEVRSAQQIPDLEKVVPAPKELVKLAAQLIEAKTQSFAEFKLENRWNKAMKAMIEEKQKGQLQTVGADAPVAPGDIMETLNASIAKIQKEKVQKKRKSA